MLPRNIANQQVHLLTISVVGVECTWVEAPTILGAEVIWWHERRQP